ncbi:hypothetical protein B1987_08575 [Mycobacterium kansasii]|nr:hypothetical protein B1987_08575 [Mycobacterium kansasii]
MYREVSGIGARELLRVWMSVPLAPGGALAGVDRKTACSYTNAAELAGGWIVMAILISSPMS